MIDCGISRAKRPFCWLIKICSRIFRFVKLGREEKKDNQNASDEDADYFDAFLNDHRFQSVQPVCQQRWLQDVREKIFQTQHSGEEVFD